MREIKFRAIMDGAIDVFNGWVYGNIMHITETYKGEEDTQEVDLWYIITNDGVQLPIKKDTIGQYTGLKDKNGKEIYEGDIIKYTDNYIAPEDWLDNDDENYWKISVVEWCGDRDYPAFDFKNGFEANGFSYIDFNDGMIEVIRKCLR